MVGDFEEGSRTWGFAMNWVLSESWVNSVTVCLSRVYVKRDIAIINKVAAVSSHSSSRNRGCFIYIYISLGSVCVLCVFRHYRMLLLFFFALIHHGHRMGLSAVDV